MTEKDNSGINTFVRIVIFGFSALLALFLTKKIQERYPDGDFTKLLKAIGICIGIFSIIIIGLTLIAVFIMMINDVIKGNIL